MNADKDDSVKLDAKTAERDFFLSRDLRPGFCRPGWGCRYCPRPACNWERRQQHLPDAEHEATDGSP